MPRTKIEFTHLPGTTGCTWNLFAGCTKVSPGCDNCWALPMTNRLAHHPTRDIREMYQGAVWNDPQEGLRWTGEVYFNPKRLTEPDTWGRKRRTVFVQSMGDLFHGQVEAGHLHQVFAKMLAHPEHTFLLLTKRPHNARGFFDAWQRDAGSTAPTPEKMAHIWFGVTVENEAVATQRMEALRHLPFPIKWVNYEPAVGPVQWDYRFTNAGVKWLAAGGENAGRKARTPAPIWFRYARNFALRVGIPFLFKQWGNWAPAPRDERRLDDKLAGREWMRWYPNKAKTGRLLDGELCNEFPNLRSYPEVKGLLYNA